MVMLTPVIRRAAAGTLAAVAAMPAAGVLGASTGPAQGTGQQVRAAELPELRRIDVPAAWRLSRGKGVTVAVLDTGADPGVPDLSGSVTSGPDYVRGADPPGYRPPHLHGTYIASLAGHGSGPGRSGGVIGVAPLPGPIQVVHRSYARIAALGAVAAAAAVGFLLALTLLVRQVRRGRAGRGPEPGGGVRGGNGVVTDT
jgi:hypothetical protein